MSVVQINNSSNESSSKRHPPRKCNKAWLFLNFREFFSADYHTTYLYVVIFPEDNFNI